MKMDVIIPVYRPGAELFLLLDRLHRQILPVGNIILMNTGEEHFRRLLHENPGKMENYPKVSVFHLTKGEFDHGGTRHQGVLHSDAELFLTMTQDALPADKFLTARLAEALKGEGIAVAYARQLPAAGADALERISREFNYPGQSCVKTAADLHTLGIKTYFCSNVCAAYRRDIYDEFGGFLRHTIFNEDMIYAANAVKAGYGIAYCADARVFHSHHYTNLQQLKRNFDLGVSQADHPEVFAGVVSESEGKKLVKAAWKRLREQKRLPLFPIFLVQSTFKYTGFLLGKHYRKLPEKWVLALTGNREYWARRKAPENKQDTA